ncbi:HAD family phosphatase [Streptomyces sp. BE20]|uniref:HAD family hydrolase n=1 Tax=Streptomycetaceae TaxID=2062 RepID=UPI002E7A6186|nr:MULTISPECIES: HAD family phosphatase [unclassified Streptomyces]MED7951459.1 HAD family phosphatase [Streptomyces sp. BE303]MEE1822452.1 HAD family phosphatase [Streptomyces sp. BE20]
MTTISTAIQTLDPGDGQGLQAVLLDMDGTLVDTEDYWWQAEASLFAELGYALDEKDRAQVVGGPMSRVIDYLLATTGVDLAPADLTVLINQRFVDLLAGGVPLMPGAERLLNTLAAHGVPAALVSASHRHIIDIVLRSLGAEHFAFTVAGDEVPRTKPHPDPYLEAARRLGADPARCVVVEDAPTGVRAAEAAGCPVIAVPSVAAIEPAPGRLVLSSLEQVDLELLRSLVASRV